MSALQKDFDQVERDVESGELVVVMKKPSLIDLKRDGSWELGGVEDFCAGQCALEIIPSQDNVLSR